MNRNILLVEDDPDVADGLSQLLASCGYQVHAAADGAKALRLLRSQLAPALIILDLRMPNLDGFRFRELQSAEPALANIATIVTTADRNVNPGALGVDGCFLKPFDCDAFLAEVARLIERA